MTEITITSIDVKDVRFPTSLEMHGSDAMHTDPDYSCAYVVLKTSIGLSGYGLTFTLGRGTEIVVCAIKALDYLVVGIPISNIFEHFGNFWRTLTSESQLRWIGPEKGVIHLATAAIVNALWDLWARLHNKPLWKLLCDLEPQVLVSTIDFRYIKDVITPEEAIDILKSKSESKVLREKEMAETGYPAYTTQVGWLGYSDKKVSALCTEYLAKGFKAFKIKVGSDLENDKQRCHLVRKTIGDNNILMMDANQKWEVQEAITWTTSLAEFKPLWIEEPTSPDDILGHALIAQKLNPLGIGVATGEMCCNRVMFKQFLQSGAMEYCQIDSCRIGGVNELLAVYLMAHKFNVKICPHAGGVGLCEMVQHLQFWDYISLSGTSEGRMIEYVDQQHEHFVHPVRIINAHYQLPQAIGYSTQMTLETLEKYEYPTGKEWKKLKSSVLSSRRKTVF